MHRAYAQQLDAGVVGGKEDGECVLRWRDNQRWDSSFFHIWILDYGVRAKDVKYHSFHMVSIWFPYGIDLDSDPLTRSITHIVAGIAVQP